MKKLFLFALIFTVISCKKEPKKGEEKAISSEIKKEKFPKELAKVFEKHGEIATWRKAKTLSFNKGNEAHTADLESRKTIINTPTYSI
ncbi:MAG: DUF6503 family protein, partial [Polaribacter sp.]